MDMHLMGVYLIDVNLTGIHLTGVHLIGVYLISVHLMSHRCAVGGWVLNFGNVPKRPYRRFQKSVADGIFDLAYELAVATPPNYHSSNTTLL